MESSPLLFFFILPFLGAFCHLDMFEIYVKFSVFHTQYELFEEKRFTSQKSHFTIFLKTKVILGKYRFLSCSYIHPFPIQKYMTHCQFLKPL